MYLACYVQNVTLCVAFSSSSQNFYLFLGMGSSHSWYRPKWLTLLLFAWNVWLLELLKKIRLTWCRGSYLESTLKKKKTTINLRLFFNYLPQYCRSYSCASNRLSCAKKPDWDKSADSRDAIVSLPWIASLDPGRLTRLFASFYEHLSCFFRVF